MTRTSAKRKARSARLRENIYKRWRRDTSTKPPSTSTNTSPFQAPCNISAASYRHSLLPPEYQKVQDVRDNSAMYTISHQRLAAVLNMIACTECGEKSTWKLTPNYFDCAINIRCDNCENILLHSEPEKCKNGGYSQGNVIHVYHSLCEGYGRAGLSRLSAGMGTKEMSAATYTNCANYLYSEMNEFYNEHQLLTRTCIENEYEKQGTEKDVDGVLNIEVGFDGTWMTRGHKSHIGAAFIVDIPTGLAVDFEVMNNYCRLRLVNKKKKDKKSFEEWHKSHAKKCQVNFQGLAGAMEPEGAVRIWGRSEDNGLRYKTFLGDGDSSSYKAVTNMNGGKGPYKDIQVQKEECINHVQKRMGTRLRKLKGELKEEKTTKTGKMIKRSLVGGKHQLTDKQIDAYQRYYGKAIRDSVGTDVTTMRLRIMSGFWHSISRDGDGNHHHIHCDTSWCVFKKAIEEKKPLPSHDTMRNYLRLEKKYEDQVREVFRDLSSPALLERCLRGKSQNKNESFHSKLWLRQSKVKFAGLQRVKFVTQLTLVDHNFGYVANRFLQHLDFAQSTESLLAKERMDKRKTRAPKSRKKKTSTKPAADYQPGGF